MHFDKAPKNRIQSYAVNFENEAKKYFSAKLHIDKANENVTKYRINSGTVSFKKLIKDIFDFKRKSRL